MPVSSSATPTRRNRTSSLASNSGRVATDTVTPGTKIVWINKDQIPHTISTTDKSFMSKAMDTDDKYEQTFVNAGDFSYFCTLHPFMTGIVHVHR